MKTIFEIIADAQTRYPVDVEGLAKALGIKVRLFRMPSDVSGALICDEDGSYRIHVNSEHPLTRRRFTIAHELGHYVLHRALIGRGVNDNRAYRTTKGEYYNPEIGPKQETEANRFAASLLMPQELIDRLQEHGMGVDAMARALEVSNHAMHIRLGLPFNDAA